MGLMHWFSKVNMISDPQSMDLDTAHRIIVDTKCCVSNHNQVFIGLTGTVLEQ